MKEKKRSAAGWILEWAGQKRSAYVWSVVLAVLNVVFKIIPYFIIADVVKLFLDGNRHRPPSMGECQTLLQRCQE